MLLNGKTILGSKGTVDSDPPLSGNLLNHTVMWSLKGSRLISVAMVADGSSTFHGVYFSPSIGGETVL